MRGLWTSRMEADFRNHDYGVGVIVFITGLSKHFLRESSSTIHTHHYTAGYSSRSAVCRFVNHIQ